MAYEVENTGTPAEMAAALADAEQTLREISDRIKGLQTSSEALDAARGELSSSGEQLRRLIDSTGEVSQELRTVVQKIGTFDPAILQGFAQDAAESSARAAQRSEETKSIAGRVQIFSVAGALLALACLIVLLMKTSS